MSTSVPVQGVLDALEKSGSRPKLSGSRWMALCPAHEDKTPSLSVREGGDGKALVKCMAGCATPDVVSRLGLTMPDLFKRGNGNGSRPAKQAPITLKELADKKRLPVGFLSSLGWSDGPGGIVIPYRLIDGSPAPRSKKRWGQRATDGSCWWPRKGPPPIPLGLDRLTAARAKGFLVLVEGETDYATLTYHDFPALGIPGADMYRKLELEHLAGFDRVYVVHEPDRGGDTFVPGVTTRRRELEWSGQVFQVRLPNGIKDVSDLHVADPDGFKAAFRAALERATPIVDPSSDVSESRSQLAQVEPVDSRAPRNFPLTDSGNGELIAQLCGDRLRFDHRRRRWLIFKDGHWCEDDLDQVRQLAKDAARTRYADALNCADQKDRRTVSSWALRSEARGQIDSALTMARSESPIADDGEGWDADPYLIGVLNGVVDLRTGNLREGRKEDRITMVIPVAFDPVAPAPRWDRFLLEIFDSDEAMIAFVRRAAGYSLTGLTREQCLFLLYGAGANGKTALLRALRQTFGPYAADTPFSTLEFHARAVIPSDVAALAGKRLVISSETGAATRLNEARIKALTGEDDVTARFLYGNFFTYRPECKLWLAANHKPRVTDTSKGFWRRVRLIPFTQSFDPSIEPDLEVKLKTERPGILAWAVRGALEWLQEGLNPPVAVTQATEDYRVESDPLADFLAECTSADPTARVKAGRLYRAYASWARGQGLKEHERLGSRNFGEEVTRGFDKKKDRGGWWYLGLELNSEGEALADRELK